MKKLLKFFLYFTAASTVIGMIIVFTASDETKAQWEAERIAKDSIEMADKAKQDAAYAERQLVRDIKNGVKHYLDRNLNDAKSYEEVEWSGIRKENEGFVIKHTYRAKNGLGATMLYSQLFYLDVNKSVTKVVAM